MPQFVNNTITQIIFSSSTDEAALEKSASVKMIDFAHVWPAEVVLVIDAVDDGVVLMVMVIGAPRIVESCHPEWESME